MSEQQADKQASDAIVAVVAFYTASLARADVERVRLNNTIAERDKTIIAMIDESKFDAKKTNDIRIDREKYQQEAHDVKCEVGTLKAKLESAEQALKTEKQKSNRLELEKSEMQQKCEQQRKENEHVQRALLESHNERDGLRKKVHESGESMGWLKNDANRFVSQLRNMAATTLRVVDTVDDVLTVISDAIEEYRVNHPPVVIEPTKLLNPKF